MRWKINKPEPQLGEKRYRKVFAWLPEDVEEYRVWLEDYEIVEEFKEVDTFDEILDEVVKVKRWVEIKRNLVVYFV